MAKEWDPKHAICGQIDQFCMITGVKLLNNEKMTPGFKTKNYFLSIIMKV